MRNYPAWTILGSLLLLLLASQFRASAGGAPGAGDAPMGSTLSIKGPTLFDDWPKPSLALVLTGSQDGYMEPCGCSGEEHKKGGLSRRDRFVQSLVEKQWPVVAMDVGSVVKDAHAFEMSFQGPHTHRVAWCVLMFATQVTRRLHDRQRQAM